MWSLPLGTSYERMSFDSNAEALFFVLFHRNKEVPKRMAPGLLVFRKYVLNEENGSGLDKEDFSFRRVLAHAFDAVQAGSLALVAFGDGDDLAILGFEAEAEFSGLIGIHLELRMRDFDDVCHGLIFELGFNGIAAHAFDALSAGGIAGVDF